MNTYLYVVNDYGLNGASRAESTLRRRLQLVARWVESGGSTAVAGEVAAVAVAAGGGTAVAGGMAAVAVAAGGGMAVAGEVAAVAVAAGGSEGGGVPAGGITDGSEACAGRVAKGLAVEVADTVVLES